MAVAPARRAAWDVLCAYLVADPKSARLGSKKRPFPPASLDGRDRASARRLAGAVVRRRLTLDTIVAQLAKGRRPRPAGLRAALLLGAWELLFDPTATARDTVRDAVDLARNAAGEGGARFANALLRRLASAPSVEAWLSPGTETGDWSVWWSYPPELIERWIAAHGADAAAELFEAGNAEPSLSLRANTTRTEPHELAEHLAKEDVATKPTEHPIVLRLERTGRSDVLETKCFEGGLFSVQDPTQAEVVDLLDLSPGQRVLDYCAAPGGKSTAIAEAIRDDGEVVAFDVDPERLTRLPAEAARLGLGCIRVAGADDLGAAFDRILVDVPCSNTGVLHRRPEARWRFSTEQLARQVVTQESILRKAATHLAPGGRLVYSTCSIEPEENEDLIARLAPELGLRVVWAGRTLPCIDQRDGGGAAVLTPLVNGSERESE